MNRRRGIWLFGCLLPLLSACSQAGVTPAPETTGQVKLTLAAYTTPREAYAEVIPAFQRHWLEQTGQRVVFEESYLGSGAQSRAIIEGFEADIAALSLAADIDRVVEAGLIEHDWRAKPHGGIVTTSIVVFAVRPGNPRGIHDWADLAQPGLAILTPNPKTSGGAMWNILALYGAARRGQVSGVPPGDEKAAYEFLKAVLANVTVMDKGARESITNFEKGIGEVAITYENEVLVGQASGEPHELVIPRSTILIENPVAVVDAYADKHGTRQVAEAFLAFLFEPPAQEIFARHGLRAVDPSVAAASKDRYPRVDDLFTIEEFGGWPKAMADFFAADGVFNRAIAEVQTRR